MNSLLYFCIPNFCSLTISQPYEVANMLDKIQSHIGQLARETEGEMFIATHGEFYILHAKCKSAYTFLIRWADIVNTRSPLVDETKIWRVAIVAHYGVIESKSKPWLTTIGAQARMIPMLSLSCAIQVSQSFVDACQQEEVQLSLGEANTVKGVPGNNVVYPLDLMLPQPIYDIAGYSESVVRLIPNRERFPLLYWKRVLILVILLLAGIRIGIFLLSLVQH